jgi:hypothetical protein
VEEADGQRRERMATRRNGRRRERVGMDKVVRGLTCGAYSNRMFSFNESVG